MTALTGFLIRKCMGVSQKAVITGSVTVNRVMVKWGTTVLVKLLSQYEVILQESHLFLSQQMMRHVCNLLRNNLLDLPSFLSRTWKNKEKPMFELLDTGPVLYPLSCSQNRGNHESHFPGSYEIHVLQAANRISHVQCIVCIVCIIGVLNDGLIWLRKTVLLFFFFSS